MKKPFTKLWITKNIVVGPCTFSEALVTLNWLGTNKHP